MTLKDLNMTDAEIAKRITQSYDSCRTVRVPTLPTTCTKCKKSVDTNILFFARRIICYRTCDCYDQFDELWAVTYKEILQTLAVGIGITALLWLFATITILALG